MRSPSGSRRTSEALTLAVWLASGAALAQRPEGAVEASLPPGVRVHVRAHEDLEPDRLRELARPGVTLWLETRSNTLRASTLEHLARFDMAWVRLRAPLRPADALVFRRLPRVGAWLRADSLAVAGRLPGARQVAVEVVGPLTEAIAAGVTAGRPAWVTWAPEGGVDVLSWALFRQLPGRRVVRAAAPPVGCDAIGPGGPAVELPASPAPSPCGPGAWVVVTPETAHSTLRAILAREPSAQLVLEVGAEAGAVARARALFAHLGLGAPR